jgi:hypothetical protein
MRRTDGQRREVDCAIPGPLGPLHAPTPGDEGGPHRADGPTDGGDDRETSVWETAWIDLGGEG